MSVKYKEYFKKMLDENKRLFENFKKLHDEYAINQNILQEKYNQQGRNVLEVVREYENRLCSNTERGMYNKYSTSLAEKFQNEVRKSFPYIDHIGLKTQKPKPAYEEAFVLKKIKLR